MELELSPRQKTAIAVAVTILAAAIILAAIGLGGWAIAVFFRRFANVFLPLAVAGVMALVFRPFYVFLRARLKLPKPVALIVLFLSVVLPFAAFVTFFGARLFEQINDLVTRVPELWARFKDVLREHVPVAIEYIERHDIDDQIRDALENQRAVLAEAGSKAVSSGARGLAEVFRAVWHALVVIGQAVGATLSWAVLPVYLAFFLMADLRVRSIDELGRLLPFLKGETRDDVVYLVREFVNIIVAFFRGQLIVAFLQGVLFAIGFTMVGLKYGMVLGLLLGFLNIIPYLGSIVGLGITIPLALFQQGGGVTMAAWMLGVFAIVQVIEGYVLTPRIMGDRTGLHPLAIIVSVFFWGSALGGVMGMILAIPLTAFLVVFWRLAQEKYIEELV